MSAASFGQATRPALFMIALLVAACGGGSDDGAPADGSSSGDGAASTGRAVESSDGVATLSIPDGALPEGVSASEIRVTTLSIADAPSSDDGDAAVPGVLASFELAPSGLRFEEPVELTVTLPVGVIGGPLVAELVSDDGATEVLLPTLVELPGDNEHVQAVTMINHFSGFLLSDLRMPASDMLSVDLEAPSSVPVGTSFEVSLGVARPDDPYEVTAQLYVLTPEQAVSDHRYRVVPLAGAWYVTGSFFSIGEDVISPRSFPPGDVPRTDLSGSTFTANGTFTCAQTGAWTVVYSGFANFRYEATPVDPPPGASLPVVEPGRHGSLFGPQVSGECVAAAVPTEEPRTTANRPPIVSPIRATVALPVTTYTIAVTDPDDDRLVIQWSGPNCGGTSGTTTTSMAWTHDGDNCPHDTATHEDVAITVLVSDGVWEVRCRYQGAGASGTSRCEEAALLP